uniref:Zona pellucida sperm-binding protein 3 n=1 Tax=Sinocyclocheilus anshuiensis TaxID=1608454 RepID=A0A671QIL3_9TELE
MGIPPIAQRCGPGNPASAPQGFPAPFPVQTPTRSDFRRPSQDLFGVQSKELMLGPVTKLTWRFPSPPEESQQPDIPFELRHPVPANSVAAQCGENSIYVEVMEDFFGTGKPLRSSALTLGSCTATGEDPSAQVLVFESEMHRCGSVMAEHEIVYTFRLLYTPQEASYGVPVRSSSAVVGIECHYSRCPNDWLVEYDWRFERPSNQYFLSDIINFEASVRSYNHVPFRVCVDNYVATAVPDVSAAPRYPLLRIKGKECMVDAKITGSKSHFMTQSQGDKLQFQLEAFRFQQVYITCIVKATAASNPTSPEQKACSWVSSDESDQVCDCCDTTCSTRSGIDNVSAGPVSRGGLMF